MPIKQSFIPAPRWYGLRLGPQVITPRLVETGTMRMLKVAFCYMLGTWLLACLATIIYSRDIAAFLVEHMQ